MDVGALYEEHHQAVLRFLVKRTASVQLAEDLAQEVWIKVHRAAPRYEDRGAPVRAWLIQIAANHLRDHWRTRRPPSAPLDLVGELAAVTSDAGNERQAERLELERLLERLNPQQAQVIRARFLVGMTQRETSGVTGTTVEAVKKMQARALVNLRRMLEAA